MKDKIAFVWQGSSNPKIFEHWNDGLREALRLLPYEIVFHEPWDDITEQTVLYWEAPVTIKGKDSAHYRKILSLPQRKILLFAGGKIEKDWIKDFDHIFVESDINLKEILDLNLSVSIAFGINDTVFKPLNLEKKWDGIHHGTCAAWKRQHFMGEALGNKGILVGRLQENDRFGFDESRRRGATVLDEQPYEEVAKLLNQSKYLIQTSDYWGGGQRATLEAMACGIPVICMSDSPKNREYVEESGFGVIVEPNTDEIRKVVYSDIVFEPSVGVNYIKSKWTAQHYADALKKYL